MSASSVCVLQRFCAFGQGAGAIALFVYIDTQQYGSYLVLLLAGTALPVGNGGRYQSVSVSSEISAFF